MAEGKLDLTSLEKNKLALGLVFVVFFLIGVYAAYSLAEPSYVAPLDSKYSVSYPKASLSKQIAIKGEGNTEKIRLVVQPGGTRMVLLTVVPDVFGPAEDIDFESDGFSEIRPGYDVIVSHISNDKAVVNLELKLSDKPVDATTVNLALPENVFDDYSAEEIDYILERMDEFKAVKLPAVAVEGAEERLAYKSIESLGGSI